MANALDYYGDPDTTTETRKFVRNFDRFFDCLNVRCTQEGIQKRKPDLRPYRDPSDSRLTVSVLDPSYTHTQVNYVSTFMGDIIVRIAVAKGRVPWLP